MIMNTPLLSVIIPTHNRPQYLPRAVKTALQSAPNGDVEVIIVPNGGDETWKESLNSLIHDPRIIVSPIGKGHANIARNHGLKLAKGKYVRFLDDDDFFLENAKDQLLFAIQHNLEICSGYIRHYTEEQGMLERVSIPSSTDDFIQACLEISGLTLVHGNIYLRECLKDAKWDETIPRLQDNIWMLNLAQQKEWQWKYFEQDIGVWVHHSNFRVSLSGASQPAPWIVDALYQLLYSSKNVVNLNPLRREKIICALREYAHTHFPNSPIYCHKLILETHRLKDNYNINNNSLLWLDLYKEWLIYPYRFIKNQLRGLNKFFKKGIVRKL